MAISRVKERRQNSSEQQRKQQQKSSRNISPNSSLRGHASLRPDGPEPTGTDRRDGLGQN